MVFTMGPATSAPVSSTGWLGMATAMATVGLLAGARAIIQSVVRVLPTPTWAVPVLAATSHEGGNPSWDAVPNLTTLTMRARSAAAVAGELARCHALGWYCSTRLFWESRISYMTWGVITTPPLAIPAATSAICSGVATVQSWPIDA